MNDAVVWVHHSVISQSEILGVAFKRVDLRARHGIGNLLVLVVGWGVVVGHTDNLLRTQTFDAALSQAGECLWACHFMTVESVDI